MQQSGDHVSAGGVQHALGLSRRARRVEHEKRRLRVHPLHRALGRSRFERFVPPSDQKVKYSSQSLTKYRYVDLENSGKQA